MRIIVDIPKDQIQGLAAICKAKKLSRSEIVRTAIEAYVSKNLRLSELQGFGLWKNRVADGLVYQEDMREEWER